MTYIIAASRGNYEESTGSLAKECEAEFIFISSKEELTYQKLTSIQPQKIFFPHWSYIIPEEIYTNFECVIFHMTDLPFGRGGSPLQNLISRGIYETKISAIKCEKEIDAGDIYLKRDLSLHGNAEEIFMRAAGIIEEMIIDIIKNKPKPTKQEGDITYFKRRTALESNIADIKDIKVLYDYIRMLDAKGYPQAFLENEYFRFEFSRAALKPGEIIADVRIIAKGEVDNE